MRGGADPKVRANFSENARQPRGSGAGLGWCDGVHHGLTGSETEAHTGGVLQTSDVPELMQHDPTHVEAA